MIDGEKILVGGKEKVLPPLNWKACKKFFKEITGNKLNDADLGPDLMEELIHAALVRNYPEFTRENLEEDATFGEIKDALAILLRLSGFVPGETAGGSKPVTA
jgi:hypothetical protein